MKTIEDLRKLREKLQADTKIRNTDTTKIIIGMGTCGIAAGAREVMLRIIDVVNECKLTDVVIQQTGCIGICEKEVLVDVAKEGEPRISYARVTPADAERIVKEHVIKGQIVEDLVFAKM